MSAKSNKRTGMGGNFRPDQRRSRNRRTAARTAARRAVSEKRNTRYHIDCGNGPDYGQVLLGCGSKLLPWPETAEPDLVADVPEDNAPSCSMAEALEKQELFVNDFAVRIASAILWDMFRHGGTDVQGAYYTTSPVRITPVMIKDLRSKK